MLTDDGVTGILIAHLGVFGSGELIKREMNIFQKSQSNSGGPDIII